MLHVLQPFITNLFKNIIFVIFDIYGWKAQLLLYSNQKTQFQKYIASKSAQRLISETMIFPNVHWQRAILP